MSNYELACDVVLLAQEKRVSLKQDHHSECNCDGCVPERKARLELEQMPEHAIAKKNWVIAMREQSIYVD